MECALWIDIANHAETTAIAIFDRTPVHFRSPLHRMYRGDLCLRDIVMVAAYAAAGVKHDRHVQAVYAFDKVIETGENVLATRHWGD
jgi:hypothetical protein